jgi:cytochrome c5
MHHGRTGLQAMTFPARVSGRAVFPSGAMARTLAWMMLVGPLFAGAASTCNLPSTSGQLCVDIVLAGPPRMGSYASWDVKVTGKDGRPAEVSLSVRGGMPAHGHGLPSKPVVRRVGPGAFTVEGLMFNMPGEWVVQFDLHTNGATSDMATKRFVLGV